METAEADDRTDRGYRRAAIAAAEGTTTDGFVVRSIRKINRKEINTGGSKNEKFIQLPLTEQHSEVNC